MTLPCPILTTSLFISIGWDTTNLTPPAHPKPTHHEPRPLPVSHRENSPLSKIRSIYAFAILLAPNRASTGGPAAKALDSQFSLSDLAEISGQ